MQERLDGKLAIVTGAGQGIGKAVALRLSREGADVVVADINTQSADQTAEQILSLDGRALSCPVDVASLSEIQSMVDCAAAQFGQIDILVNAAGVAQTGLFVDLTDQQWDRVIDTNLKGTTFCVQAVGRRMIDQLPEQKRAGEIGRAHV